MTFTKYLTPFLIGGSAIAGSKYLSTKVNPAYASMLAGMPTGILGSFFLANDKVKREFYKGYAVGDVVVGITIVLIALATTHFDKINVNILSIIGYFVWLILTYIGIRFFIVKKGNKKTKKK